MHLKAIGRESVVDENGIVISESTVDYIPLNNEHSAILPKSDRIFETKWQGFVEEYTDRYGKKQYRYLTPSEKSAGRSLNERLFPWEKLETKKVQKQLTAQIDVEYEKKDGTKQEFHAAPKFLVVYDEARVVINYWPVVLVLMPVILLVGILFYLIAGLRRRRSNLRKEIRKELLKEMQEKSQK